MIKYEIPNEFLRILKGFNFRNPIEKLKITKAEIELISLNSILNFPKKTKFNKIFILNNFSNNFY